MVDQVSNLETYNYTIFEGQGDYETFPTSWHAGDQAPDFTAVLLETGEPVRLSDYWRERDVVIEFGSYT
jgi:hypothetical protein